MSIESKLNSVESKPYSFDVSKQPSMPSTKFINDSLTQTIFPNYSVFAEGVQTYLLWSEKQVLKKLPDSMYLDGYVDGGDVRRIMEKNSPKLPADLKAEQAQLKSVETRVANLQAAIQKQKTRNPNELEFINNSWMSIGGGMRINVAEGALLLALYATIFAIVFAACVNPLFALVLLLLPLLAAGVYFAPTEGNLLKAELAGQEKLTKKFQQDIQTATQFYRGQLCAEMIQDFDTQIKKIDEAPKSVVLNAERIADIAKREKLIKASAELKEMVEFFKEEDKAASKITPIAEIFGDAEFVDAKDA